MDEIPGQPETQVDVRGHSSFNAPASAGLLCVCILTDLLWIAALLAGAYSLTGAPPLFRTDLFAGWLAASALLVFLQLWLLRGTLGARLWGLHLVDGSGKPRHSLLALIEIARGRLHARVRRKPTPAIRSASIVAAVALASLAGHLTLEVLRHPAASVSSRPLEFGAFAPPVSDERDWIALPFFYTMGAWPNRFAGMPVLYTLPYAKGPPERFAGHVIGRIRMPDILLIIEGPKTPASGLDAGLMHACLTSRSDESECLRARHAALERHIGEMRALRPESWSTGWFEVRNPALPPEETPRGIRISASNGRFTEDRYILITANGSHQAIIIRAPENAEGEAARKMIEQSVSSLRVQSELGPGRALINHRLARTQMQDLRGIEDTIQFFSKLAEIQAMLVSKISVDPREHATYYHLGGTALMLIQNAAQLRTRKTQVLSSDVAFLLDEWTAAAKPLIHTAYQYARDVDAENPNTSRLQNLWIESQKF